MATAMVLYFLPLRELTGLAASSEPHTGLRAIAQLSGVKRRLLVPLGERAFTTPDGVGAIPAVEFSDELAEGRI